MRKTISILLLMFASAIFVFTACKGKNDDKEAPEPTTEQLVQRGE